MTTETMPDMRRCHGLDPKRVADACLVLSDLDGCLISQAQAYSDAPAFVETCGDRLWIVSNNSTHTAQGLASSLGALGLAIHPNRILLAGEQTLLHLARTRPGQSIALYASDPMRQKAMTLGLNLVERNAEIVLICRDLSFTLPDLEKVAALIQERAQLWVSNTDVAHPALDGRPVPETGALLAAIHAVVGPVAVECIGKPHPHMAQIALQQSGVAARDAVFVGDNADTDGALAHAAGLPFLHLVREPAE